MIATPARVALVTTLVTGLCCIGPHASSQDLPAEDFAVLLADGAVSPCGTESTLSLRVRHSEPIWGVQLALSWDPTEAIEIVGIEPSPEIPASDILAFFGNYSDPSLGVGENEAKIGLVLETGILLPESSSTEIARIQIRANEGAVPGESMTICAENGIGSPPLQNLVTVPRELSLVSVPLALSCAEVVIEDEAPALSIDCPPQVVVDADASPDEDANVGAFIHWVTRASGGCGKVELVCEPPSGSFFSVGTTVVTCTAVDAVGEAVVCEFDVTVRAREIEFLRGDSNQDGGVDISDGVETLGVLFLGLTELGCHDAADANDDGRVDVSDALVTFGFLFQGGSEPPAPYPLCGVDPTPDPLGCQSHAPCSDPAPSTPLGPSASFIATIHGAHARVPELGLADEHALHLVYAFRAPGDFDEAMIQSWAGSLLLVDPSRQGEPFVINGVDESEQAIDEEWFHVGAGRLVHVLRDSRQQTVGLLGVGPRASILALDLDSDGTADVVNLIDEIAGEFLAVKADIGMEFFSDLSIALLSDDIRDLNTKRGYDPLTTLRALFGMRLPPGIFGESRPTPSLFPAIWTPISDQVGPVARYDLQMPHALPLPPEDYADRLPPLDFPEVDYFRATVPTCTPFDPTAPVLEYSVSAGPGGSGVERIRIAGSNVDPIEFWEPVFNRRPIFEPEEVFYDESSAPQPRRSETGIVDPRSNGFLNHRYYLRAWNEIGFGLVRRASHFYTPRMTFEVPATITERAVEVHRDSGTERFFEYRIPITIADNVEEILWGRERNERAYLRTRDLRIPPTRDAITIRISGDDRFRGIKLRARSGLYCPVEIEREITVNPAPEPEEEHSAATPTPHSPSVDLVPFVGLLTGASFHPGMRNIGTDPYPLPVAFRPTVTVSQFTGTTIDTATLLFDLPPRAVFLSDRGVYWPLAGSGDVNITVLRNGGISEPTTNNRIAYYWDLGSGSWRRR